MQFDSLFMAALQSSLVLGLIHGVNPCGHSWLILAPFITGNKPGNQVALLTFSFIGGTAMACLALGASLGAISLLIPSHLQWFVEVGTGIILIVLGVILIIKPNMLHQHDHNHEHAHHDEKLEGQHCKHGHHSCNHHEKNGISWKYKTSGVILFGIGFVNMIIPCPTVAIMYGYALKSGNVLNTTSVFAVYALTTGLAVSGVIYTIYRISTLLKTLRQNWIETAIMRTVGLVTVLFSTISLYQM